MHRAPEVRCQNQVGQVLEAVAQADPEHSILLLHADTLFESKRSRLPSRTVGGSVYDVAELMNGKVLPQHIQFVWQIADGHPNLTQFLASEIHWVQCDVHLEPIYQEVTLHPTSWRVAEPEQDAEALRVAHVLEHVSEAGKGVCLNLQVGGSLVDRILEMVRGYGLDGPRLWFCGRLEDLQKWSLGSRGPVRTAHSTRRLDRTPARSGPGPPP